MRTRSLNDLVRRIVRVALASSVSAAAYACGAQDYVAVPSLDGGGAPDASTDTVRAFDAADPAFVDEDTFACDAPLPSILDQLTPVKAVDYIELRNQGWMYHPDGSVPQGATIKVVAKGTPCANAANPSACSDALAALAPTNAGDGWLAEDPGGPAPQAEVLQILGMPTFAEARILLDGLACELLAAA